MVKMIGLFTCLHFKSAGRSERMGHKTYVYGTGKMCGET